MNSNWSTTTAVAGADPGSAPGSGDVAFFTVSGITVAQTVNLDGARTVLGLDTNAQTATTTLVGGTGNQILSIGTSGIDHSNGGFSIGSASEGQKVSISLLGSQTWTSSVTSGSTGAVAIRIFNDVSIGSGGDQTLTLAGANNGARIDGAIADGAAVLSLAKDGSSGSIWSLNAVNTYSGATTITGGTLRLQNVSSILNSSAISITGVGARLLLENDPTANANRISGNVTLSNSGELSMTSNSGASMNETFGSLTIGEGASTVSVGSATNRVNSFSATSFTRVGTGTAYIRGANLGTDGTSNIGRVFIDGAAGTGLTYVGTNTSTTGIPGTTTNLKIVPYFIGNTSAGGAMTDSTVNFVTYDTATGLRTLGVNEVVGTLATAGADENVKKTGGSETGIGSKTINSLLLNVGGLNLTGTAGSTLTVTSGALAHIAGSAPSFATISGFDTIMLGDGASANEAVITSSNTNLKGLLTISSSVNVTGGGGVTKAGLGIATLAGNNVFTGAININEGILNITGTNVNSGVNIQAGATLGVGDGGTTGSMGGVAVANAGSVAFNRRDTGVVFANNVSGAGGLVQNGSGSTRLTGASTFTGGLAVNNGNLVLDYSTNAAVVGASNTATLNSGKVTVDGRSTGVTAQALASVTTSSNSGLNTLAINSNGGTSTTLTSALSRGGNSTLFIDLSGAGAAFNTSATVTNSLLGNTTGIVIKDANGRIDFAGKAANNLTVIALNASTVLPATGGSSTTNYRLAGGLALTGNTTSKSLRIDSTGAGQSLDIGASNLVIAAGGILYVGNQDYTLDGTGYIATATAGGSSAGAAIIENYGTGKLTINTRLANANVNGGGGSVTIAGPGLVDWAGASNSNGTVVLSGGTVRISGSAINLTNAITGDGSGVLYINSDAVLELATGDFTRGLGTTAGTVNLKGNAGFSAYGAARNVTLDGGNNIGWGSSSGFLNPGGKLLLGSTTADNTVTFTNNLDLLAGTRVVDVRNGSAIVEGRLSGVVSGAATLVKSGLGTLDLTGANTYSRGTFVDSGRLIANNGSALGTGGVNIATGALLTVGDSPTTGLALSVGDVASTGTIQLDVFNTVGSGATYSTATADYLAFNTEAILGTLGTLNLVNLSGELAFDNARFNLVDWSSVSGKTVTGFTYTGFDLDNTNFDTSNFLTEGYIIINTIAVPEPSRMLLLLGALGLFILRRRRAGM